MIVFDLRCLAAGHVFEAWFGSSGDYQDQSARGLVSCPVCGGGEVEKAAMAPRLSPKGNSMAPSPAEMKVMLSALAGAQKKALEGSDYVGETFADEARAIHLGEAEARSIHGKASHDEAKSLIDEGVPVSPLPFPVIEPEQEN